MFCVILNTCMYLGKGLSVRDHIDLKLIRNSQLYDFAKFLLLHGAVLLCTSPETESVAAAHVSSARVRWRLAWPDIVCQLVPSF